MVSPKQLLSIIESTLLGPIPPTPSQRIELTLAIRQSLPTFQSLLSYPPPKASDRAQVESKEVRLPDSSPISLDDQDVQIAHPTHEKFLNKKIEMYDEMSLVLGKDCATGSFAKSFIDVDLEARSENEVLHVDGDVRSEVSSQPRQHRKRTRDKYDGDASLALISEKLGAMADAITRLTGDRLNVQVLHDEIMAMDGFDEFFLGSAFDYLVQHEMLAKAFLAKRDNFKKGLA